MEWPLIGRESDLDQAVELVEAGTGIAFLGPAGVGKSRLLHELADRAQAAGKAVVKTVAAESMRSIPFAPFVELLPEEPSDDRLAVLSRALTALAARNKGRGLLMTVDDAHHLDPSSLALLVQAVASDAATVCLTARTGEEMHPDLVDLWTNGVMRRADLTPLAREHSRQLAETVLGPLDAALSDELWRLAEGNPLVLHELIEGSAHESLVAGDDGLWRQVGPLAESARVADLVMSRLRALPEQLRPAMDIVAVASPIPMPLALAAGGAAIADLENRGLIRVTESSGERVVVPAHPLYGEILQANIGEARTRTALNRIVDHALEADSPVDLLRVAVWQSDSGTLRSASVAMDGATLALARHDPGLAERLVRPLADDMPQAQLIVGRALSYQQQFGEADQMLAAIETRDPLLAGEVASVRAQNLAFGLGRIDEARTLLETAVSEVEDAELRARLHNERGMISAIRGDFVDARRAATEVLEHGESGEVARVSAYATLTVAQAMTGDSAGLEEQVDEAIVMAIKVGRELPFARDQIEIMRVASMLNAGHIAEAISLAENAVSREDRGVAMVATWMSALSLALDLAGLHTQSTVQALGALERYTSADPFGLEAQSRGVAALGLAQQGDETADEVLVEVMLPVPAPRLTVWVERGKAWASVARGNVEKAMEILVAAGRHAAGFEHFAWATMCFHDVVRLGAPELVRDDLASMPDMPGAHLLHAMQNHAEALLSDDVERLEGVAATFATMGASLLGAEAWAQVAFLTEEQVGRARASLLSATIQERCEGSVTPALLNRPSEITGRETQVAVAAAAGMASPEIAESAYISTRTVENHLQSVYRKLGIGSRDELRSLLSEAG